MPAAAPRKTVYLHIGLHKTGTTYLQNVLRANTAALARQGICYPGRSIESQKLAVWDLFGRRPKGAADGRINGKWQLLVDEVMQSEHPVGLVSEEYLSLAGPGQARRAVSSFGDAEVHVIVTARDLARVLVSAWQEEVKNDATWTWSEFADAVRDPAARAQNPARGFWLRQALSTITETWSGVVPTDRLHLITVPPAGSPSGLLLDRFAAVVGFDPASLTEAPRWNNETLGAAGTEVLRRLNVLLGHRLNQRQYRRVIKTELAPALARRLGSPKFGLPSEHDNWLADTSKMMIEAVAERGYRIVGDLDDLLPVPSTEGRHPDETTSEELLEAAMVALAEVTEQHATAWWGRRPPDRVVRTGNRMGRAVGASRGVVFRTKRRAAELADHNAVAGRLMAVYLDRRAAAVRRRGRSRAAG